MRINERFYINRNNYRLQLFNSSISKNLWIESDSRMEDEHFFADYIKDNDFVVDVGSNIGNLTICAALLVKKSKSVYSIEANEKIFNYQRKNVALNNLNDIVVMHNLAVGEENKRIGLSNEKNDGMVGVSTTSEPEVSMKTLDSILPEGQATSLLKIDVEGYELMVLKGAITSLKHTEGVYFEFNDDFAKRYDYGLGDILSCLKSCGMNIYSIDIEAKKLSKVEEEVNLTGTHNLLAYNDSNFNLKDRLSGYTMS